jgi:hypothetical protein
VRPAIERQKAAALDIELDGHDLALGTHRILGIAGDLSDGDVPEDGLVKRDGLFGLVIEPQAGSDLVHCDAPRDVDPATITVRLDNSTVILFRPPKIDAHAQWVASRGVFHHNEMATGFCHVTPLRHRCQLLPAASGGGAWPPAHCPAGRASPPYQPLSTDGPQADGWSGECDMNPPNIMSGRDGMIARPQDQDPER